MQAAVRLSPDVVVLDASMPILNRIDAAREIKKLRPATAIVFLSMHSNAIYLRKALEAGASGGSTRQPMPQAPPSSLKDGSRATPRKLDRSRGFSSPTLISRTCSKPLGHDFHV